MGYDVKSFRAWATYYDVAQELTEREQGQFYRAIFEFMFAGQDVEERLPKTARICFKSIKPNLKRSKSKARSADETDTDDAVLEQSTSNENETKTSLNLNSRSKKLRSKELGEGDGLTCEVCHSYTVYDHGTGRRFCPTCGEVKP